MSQVAIFNQRPLKKLTACQFLVEVLCFSIIIYNLGQSNLTL